MIESNVQILKEKQRRRRRRRTRRRIRRPPTLSALEYSCVSHLKDFGVQTTVIAAPLRWVGLLPAVLGPGDPGTQVAQTLRFSRFIVCPPSRSTLKCFGLKIVLSLWFSVHVFSWPRFLSTGSALGALGPKSLQYYTTFRVHISETSINTHSKSKLCIPIGTFDLLAAVL